MSEPIAANVLEYRGRKLSAPYRGYPAWIPDEAIRQAFYLRHGYDAAELIRTAGCVLAGPIKTQEEGGNE